MKKKKQKKNRFTDYPKYKLVIPFIICIYLIMSMFVPGINKKEILLTVASVSMVAWFIGERIFPDKVYMEDGNRDNKVIYILLGIFMAGMVLSALFAKDYSDSSLIGEYDSIITIFGYIILFYMTYKYGHKKESQWIFHKGILIIAVITVVMSIIEFLDIKLAILWIGNEDALYEMNRVALSFGNSNYYGAFCCMLIPFVVKLWMSVEDRIKKSLLILLNAALICCVLLSKSTMAIYLMCLIMVGMVVYGFKEVIKQWVYILICAISFGVIVIVLNICSSGKMFELINIGIGNSDAFVEEKQEVYLVEDIRLEGNRLIVEGENSEFAIEYDEQLAFYDGEGNALDVESEGSIIKLTEKPYDMISLEISFNQREQMLYIELDLGYKETVDFYIANGEFKGVGADGKAVDDITGKYEKHSLNSIFTGRGYIWINTISMLDEVIFLGKGCGNFVHVFKQYDYVGLIKSQGTSNIIIDRPHNMFLQYSMDVGIIGTVAIFAMIIYILIGWIKRSYKQGLEKNDLSYPAFVSVVAFLVFILLNDSMIVLSPFMWVCLGMNNALQQREKK